MPFHTEQHVHCSPEHAFDLMADARNETAWNSQVSRSELLSGEPVALGSRFLTVNRGQEYQATISTYARPNRLAFEVTGSRMDITASFDLHEHQGTTHLHGAFDFRPKGAMRLFFPLMAPLVRRDLQQQSARFKALCERG
jgi:hypothetical protein